MAALKVICPKCFKGQQVVVDIPPAGLDYVCIFCKSAFRVKPPKRPAATPSSDDLPAAREAVPRPSDLPAARETIPRPSDLPAARETVPRPSDLPVSRDAVPRPSDLPVSRDAVPRPGDLPVAREAVPRPGDLPVAREAVPRPGDLPVSREAVPRPGDLPVDRALPSLGLSFDDDPPARPAAPPARPFLPGNRAPSAERNPSKTPPLGLALELSLASPLQDEPPPLKLDEPDSLDLSLPDLPPPPPPAPAGPPATTPRPPARPAASPTQQRPGAEPATLLGQPPAPPIPPAPSARTGAPPSLSPLVAESAAPLFQFDQVAPVVPPPSPSPDIRPARSEGRAKSNPSENLDLGFSLELEGNAKAASAAPSAIPFPAARVANEGGPEAAGEAEVPALAPPTARAAGSARALRPVAKRISIPRWAFFAAGGVVLAVVAALVLVPLLRSAPSPETVLKPYAAELAKDVPTAYRNAADALEKAATAFKDHGGPALQLAAAQILLVGYTAHGGQPAELARAEQLMQAVAGKPKLAAALARTRALLAVAKGKPREADAALTEKSSPESLWALGLSALAQDKTGPAEEALRRYVAARPAEIVGHYQLGKALLAANNPDGRKELDGVLAKNPAHAGAQIALVGLEETPEKRFAAATALLEKKSLGAGPAELAGLYTTLGLAAQALGRTPVAIDALQKAVANDRGRTEALVALGESLLYEGSYKVALEKLKAGGAAVEASPAGRFCLGGASIATGDAPQGLKLVASASKERPQDPRGPFWTGFAAYVKQPPDLSAAEQGYRDALKRDPTFLPASLKLAALLQQQNKAEDSLAVLRAAEEAGAPQTVLQLAWGEALIVAKEPAKAAEVFQRALDNDPKSVSARLGVAAALAAQHKLAEAKASLENSLKVAPETIGLRDRLAQVCLELGQKDEALAHYQDELRVQPSVAVRLAVARVALDLGKIELAQSEAKKVLDESPRNAEAAYDMARVHEAHHDSGAALQEYRHAATWGNTPVIALGFGQLLEKLGRHNEALTALANAVALPAGRMERGRILFRSGDLEGALADFQAASKMTPEVAEPLILQGLCYDKLGEGKKAEEAWLAALKAEADAPEPHYRLGRSELDRGKPTAAIEHFRKATARVPAEADWRPDLYFQLGQAELLTGAKAAALADFKKFLEIAAPNAPTRPEASQQVARLSGTKVSLH